MERVIVKFCDSLIMRLLHSAMDRAHAKVRSMESVIGRLNETSKFYELALIQLDACLMFVQEEVDSGLESSDEEVLGELAEIRDRLENRLRDSEVAIEERDRELNLKSDDECTLRHELNAKQKELDLLRENLYNGDQQFDEDSGLLDRMLNRFGIDTRIGEMESDIDMLKETMHMTLGRMQNALSLSGLRTSEQKAIEKDVMSILQSTYKQKDLVTEIQHESLMSNNHMRNALVEINNCKEIVNDLKKRTSEEISIDDFERQVESKLRSQAKKLESIESGVRLLFEKHEQMKRKKLMYKAAFESRCDSLIKAENEVNLLADQVDILSGVLERTYGMLLRHAPLLHMYIEISDVIEMMSKALQVNSII